MRNYTVQFEQAKLNIPKTSRTANIICWLITILTLVLTFTWSPAMLAGYLLGILMGVVTIVDIMYTYANRLAKDVEIDE